jgi:UDP-2,4-diacetamido-2,4,6-trideoxy-beta-L-altropyranose hydrolase
MKNNILIRTDTNTQIGSGHVMRCLALAQAWQKSGGNASFLMSTRVSHIRKRLGSEGMAVAYLPTQRGSSEDALQTAALAKKINASWIVLDGYQFDGVYQQVLKKSGLNLLFLDDYGHAGHYYADLVLNQNIYAHEGLYTNREPYTRLLLKTQYALLRNEFLKWQRWNRDIPKQARKVLVTLGGGDPENVTGKVIEAVDRIKTNGLEVVVVVGGHNPHIETLQKSMGNKNSDIRLIQNATNMSELMAVSDVAVSAGGSTCWELAFMGLPAAVLVFAENQEKIAAGLDTAGVMINLAQYKKISIEQITAALQRLIQNHNLRQEMSRRGRDLVDGMGAARVVEVLRTHLQKGVGEDRLCT